MAVLIPVTSDGNRLIEVSPSNELSYFFRTYYSAGMENAWFLDISDANGEPLLVGKPIVPGSPNILKGQGDAFRNAQLAVVVTDGSERDPDALGNGTQLVWFNEGETNPFDVGDPLLNVDAETDWDWRDSGDGEIGDHSVLANRFIPDQHNIEAISGLSEELEQKANLENGQVPLAEIPVNQIPHDELANLNEENQHPVAAITGLTDALALKEDLAYRVISGDGINADEYIVESGKYVFTGSGLINFPFESGPGFFDVHVDSGTSFVRQIAQSINPGTLSERLGTIAAGSSAQFSDWRKLETDGSGISKADVLDAVTVNSANVDLNNATDSGKYFAAATGMMNAPWVDETYFLNVTKDTDKQRVSHVAENYNDGSFKIRRGDLASVVSNPGNAFFQMTLTSGTSTPKVDTLVCSVNASGVISMRSQQRANFSIDESGYGNSLGGLMQFWASKSDMDFNADGFTLTITQEGGSGTDSIVVSYDGGGAETITSNTATVADKCILRFLSGRKTEGSDNNTAEFNLYLTWTDTDGTASWTDWEDLVQSDRPAVYSVATVDDLVTLTEAKPGDYAAITSGDEQGNVYILINDDPTVLSNWINTTGSGNVTSVNGKTGVVELDLDDFPDIKDEFTTLNQSIVAVKATADTAYEATTKNFVVGSITIYVRTTGNDTTGDGSSANPFATITGAYTRITALYPNCSFNQLTLNIGPGEFSITNAATFASSVNARRFVFSGDASSTTRINITGGNIVLTPQYASSYAFSNITFSVQSIGAALAFRYGAVGTVTNVNFEFPVSGTGNNVAIISDRGSYVYVDGTMSVSSSQGFIGIFQTSTSGSITIVLTSLDLSQVASGTVTNNRLLYAVIDSSIQVNSDVEITWPTGVTLNNQVTQRSAVTAATAARVLAWTTTGSWQTDEWSSVYGISTTTTYSTSQQATDEVWIDGSRIYRKTVSIGPLPNATTKTVAHGISTPKIIRYEGAAYNAAATSTITLPRAQAYVAGASNVDITFNSANIVIQTTQNMSSYTNAYVTLYYTL